MFPLRTLTAVLALSLAAGGCGIGCDEAQFVRAATLPGFQVTPAGAAEPVPVALFGDVGHNHAGQSDFQQVYDVLSMERRDRRAVVVTLIGFETAPADRIVLSLAIPGDAEAGDRYGISGIFPPPVTPEEQWGLQDRAPTGSMTLAFARTRASIPDPPYDYVAHYTATRASGTVAVLRRDRREMLLELDVTVRDAAGSAQQVAGRATVQLIDEGEVCFTPA